MVTATAFPEPWGFDQIVAQNTTNWINASMTAWTHADIYNGSNYPMSFASMFLFGAVIVLIAGMIYIRYQKVTPAALAALLISYILEGYGYMPAEWVWPIYLLVIIALGIDLKNLYKKDQV